MITGLMSLGALGTIVVYVAARGGRLAELGWALGVVALIVLTVGLVLRWPVTIPWSILFAGSGYLVVRAGASRVDGWAALIGVLLLAAAELGSWSIEHDARIHVERAVVKRRVATLGALLGAALLVDFMLLGTSGLRGSAGVLLSAIGVAAAVGAVAVVLRLARA